MRATRAPNALDRNREPSCGRETDWSSAAIPSNRALEGRGRLRRGLDDDLAIALAADLELGEELADVAHAGSGRRVGSGRDRLGIEPGPVRRAARRATAAAGRAGRGAATWSSDSSAASSSGSNGSATSSSSRTSAASASTPSAGVRSAADGRERRGVVDLLDPRQERARLLELDRVAVAVEEPLEERLLRADQAGDPRLDPLLADEVVDVDRLLLAEAVDPPDPLFEDGRVPGQLEVDHAVRGVLEVQPDAAGVAGEEQAEVAGRRGTRRCSGSAASVPRPR